MRRFVWFAPLALAACLSFAGMSSAPARADHGGRDDRGEHGRRGQKSTEVRERITLVGDPIDGITSVDSITPEGQAEFRARGMRRQLKVEAEDVNLPDGTILYVLVNDVELDAIELENGEGELELNTNDGDMVPAIQQGDVLTIVTEDGTPVLSGTF